MQEMAHKANVSFLHVCGGVSKLWEKVKGLAQFSPRMWRCFRSGLFSDLICIVFSTYVEVFLRMLESSDLLICFLHVCGGVSFFAVH